MPSTEFGEQAKDTIIRVYSDNLLRPLLDCNPKDRSCWGPHAWDALDAVCDIIPCSPCREHCHSMLSFEHDLVNKGQGKQLFNPENVEGHLQDIIDVFPEAKLMKPRLRD